ncbi:MAG: hypothetical protein HKN62_07890 [Phycisphaerales bacterium]|nr:hypothetical protein [Phycisphaerales bacterium]
MSNNGTMCDVAIIGGGPGGSTLGSLLRKYRPEASVVILDKERFPRDHVGESQLPPIGDVLEEMGCWDKVEAANFPIKIGATFRWGKSDDLWDFEFLPIDQFRDEPRPAQYEGQRRQTAFQVDRLVYDDILLRHAESLGCTVREETLVTDVRTTGDRVEGLEIKGGEVLTARHYVDASGHVGIMRRALGVPTEVPTQLQNIAIWDYWENAEWAVEIGVGATRVQVMSLEHGWLWFIPLGPTRTSIGFICPSSHYKQMKSSPETLYLDAIARDPRIAALTERATRRGEIETTTDWSFVAERCQGENWFLVGESAGFADPVLAAGLTLTHTGARELAYTIRALDEGEHDAAWLKEHYERNQLDRVRQHIRFADYWYAANGQFTDLQEHCQSIARGAGLRLSPEAAWRWLAQGGFTNDSLGQVGIGGLDVSATKQLTAMFVDKDARWKINDYNVFKLNLTGAEERQVPQYADGEITPVTCYFKAGHRLPMTGLFRLLTDILSGTSDIGVIHEQLSNHFQSTLPREHVPVAMKHAVQTLEVMLGEGWLLAKLDKRKPRLNVASPAVGAMIHPNVDG